MPLLDARSLIRSFEGPAHLRRRMERDGYDISIKTIERWIARERIPSDWLLILSAYAEQDGRQIRLHEYIVSDDDIDKLRLRDNDFLD